MKLKLMGLVIGLMSLQNCASDYGYQSYGGSYRQPNYEAAAYYGSKAGEAGAQIARCGLAGELCRQQQQPMQMMQPVQRPVQYHEVWIRR